VQSQLDPLLNDVGIDNPRDDAGSGGGDGRSYPTFGDPNAPNVCSYNDNVLPCDYVMKIVSRLALRTLEEVVPRRF
jgi:hypothetical protein